MQNVKIEKHSESVYLPQCGTETEKIMLYDYQI